jgi:spore maturation protein CgeB
MRVMMLRPGPSFSVADVHAGWREAFVELGCSVADVNLDDRLTFYSTAGRVTDAGDFHRLLDDDGAVWLASQSVEAALYEWPADVLFVTSCFYVPLRMLDTVRSRGTKVVICCTEQPYEATAELIRAEHADLSILNDPTHLDRFRAVGDAIYLPAAHRPNVHSPGPATPSMESDFCFVGTGFPSRVTFLEAVNWSGLDVALGGMWQMLAETSPLRHFVAHDIGQCLDNTETVKAYRSTRASVNLYRRETDDGDRAEGYAMGPREVELAACGTFFLREPRPEGDMVLSMLPTFVYPDEFEGKLRWYLAHDDLRADLARAARAAVAERIFAANAARLLEHLDRVPVTR